MPSAFITTKVVSSNPVHDEVCSIPHYVIKLVNVLRQVGSIIESGVKFHNSNSKTPHASFLHYVFCFVGPCAVICAQCFFLVSELFILDCPVQLSLNLLKYAPTSTKY